MASQLSFSVERILGNTHGSGSHSHYRRSLSCEKFTFPPVQPTAVDASTTGVENDQLTCIDHGLPTLSSSPPLSTTSEPSPLMESLSSGEETHCVPHLETIR